jgi:hypothetical protein
MPRLMYVNSPEGLRIRSNPNINSERIYLLPNKSPVEILERENEEINIDGIPGNWLLIKYNSIEGWVFSGYLINNINDNGENWYNCKSYKYVMPRPYPLSIEETNSSNTSAFEFIAKNLKNYFYPNVVTKDFYLSFYYPLVGRIPINRVGLFEETEIEIQEDGSKHYIRYDSERKGYNNYTITIKQYKNDVFVKGKQFSIIFYDDHIESPDLFNRESQKTISLIDLVSKDLELKINNASILQKLYENAGLEEGLFSDVFIRKFDIGDLIDADFSAEYIKIFEKNHINLDNDELEIMARKLKGETLNYK